MKYSDFVEDIQGKSILVVGNGERKKLIDQTGFDRVIKINKGVGDGPCDYGCLFGMFHNGYPFRVKGNTTFLLFENQTVLYPEQTVIIPRDHAKELWSKYGRPLFSGTLLLDTLTHIQKSGEIWVVGFNAYRDLQDPNNIHYSQKHQDAKILKQLIETCKVLPL